MYNDVNASVLPLVSFDKMVASAESPYAPLRAYGIDMFIAVKLGKVNLFAVAVRLLPYLKSRRYFFIDQLIKLLQLDVLSDEFLLKKETVTG